MKLERIIAYDKTLQERYSIRFLFRRVDLPALDLICKKIIRMHQITGPVYPDLTENELALIELIQAHVKKMR